MLKVKERVCQVLPPGWVTAAATVAGPPTPPVAFTKNEISVEWCDCYWTFNWCASRKVWIIIYLIIVSLSEDLFPKA